MKPQVPPQNLNGSQQGSFIFISVEGRPLLMTGTMLVPA